METTNPKVKMAFTKANIGCWIDGAYGEEHRRQKLSEMLSDCFVCTTDEQLKRYMRELQEALEQESSDDYSEEDEAIGYLGMFTAPGLSWIMEAGDLVLTDEPE